jgi:hypothetical protein
MDASPVNCLLSEKGINQLNSSFSRMTLIQRHSAPKHATQSPVGEFQGMAFYNIGYTGFALQELSSQDTDYALDRTKVIARVGKEGVKPMTQEEQEAERAMTWRLIKQFTMAILKADLTYFSFPVGYSENRTFMERASDLFAFLVSDFLERAYFCNSPEVRLSYVAVGIIASFHLAMRSKKPWNPVLGETYIARWPNGPTMYAEQISHHPPVTSIQICSQTNHWTIDATLNFEINLGVSKATIRQKGLTRLRFADGCTYKWEFPSITVLGIIRGDRIVRVRGPFDMKDVTNDLEMHVEIAPKPSKQCKIASSRASTIWGGVRRRGAGTDDFMTKITGDYMSVLCLDGQPIWEIERDFAQRPSMKIDESELLPSDCRFRIDRSMLIQGNVSGAEEGKTLMENLQRRDAKLRVKDASK